MPAMTTLYRPVGRHELALIWDLRMREFSPRLPGQPISSAQTFRGFREAQILMEANAGKRASPDWRTLYEAAVLELDPEKIPRPHYRSPARDHGSHGRCEPLRRFRKRSADALYVLQDLRKMADDG
jgi:hypothetical protein